MLAEIITYSSGLMRGKLHSKYLEEPYEFSDLMQMIEKMEEIFNEKRFPEAFLSPRIFDQAKKEVKKKNNTERTDVMKVTKIQDEQQSQSGRKCTFEISVKFRQNATWQGTILWAEKDMKQSFRSVLEMLKLMDEAISEGAEEVQVAGWGGK